jgi:hypothetical protein
VSCAPLQTHTGEVGKLVDGVQVHREAKPAEEPVRHAMKAQYDPYAHSRARLEARQQAEAAELQQSEEAALESERLAIDLFVIGKLIRELCKYQTDPGHRALIEGVDSAVDPAHVPNTRKGLVPDMSMLARAVKLAVVAVMVGDSPRDYIDRREVHGLALLSRLHATAPQQVAA